VQELPCTRVYINTGDPIEDSDLMEFRLLYEGELLPSGGSNSRAPEKHAIRRTFHPQLRRLWYLNHNLRQLATRAGGRIATSTEPQMAETFVSDGCRAIGQQWNRVGYEFVPLVTAAFALRCSLDILLLRPEEDRFIFTSGDIDGQVKTLFDALRIPANLEEAGGIGPQDGESPFFCLLEDDRLISEVRVNADQLLLLPQQKKVKANDCFVVIHVRLNHTTPRTFDNYFG